jgi:leucyl aminopeptidase
VRQRVQLATTGEVPGAISCDALVVGAFVGDDGPHIAESAGIEESLAEHVREALHESGFKGKVGDVSILPTLGASSSRSIAVVGLGPRDSAGPTEVRRAAAIAVRSLSERSEVASVLHKGIAGGDAASAEGFLLGTYSFDGYKSDPRPSKIQRVLLIDADDDAVERGTTFADATATARDLVNEPPSTLTPTVLAARAREVADLGGLECTVFDKAELTEREFGGILGVARGSEEEPRLIRLRYAPEGATGRIALIGKGVTFDSGGLSLKDNKNMEQMKTDMAGGAAVIGAMSALHKLNVAAEVIGIVPCVENMPSGSAIKPGDVIRHYGGRTTEVLNTDAEGRLILADALALACEDQPDAIVDLATLTGSIIVALGNKAVGLFSNNDELSRQLREAAASAGERVWPMPLYDDYKSELESEVADSKNIGSRWGGAIFGALFLQPFVANDIPWAHLDIAGPARSDRNYDDVSRGGTGVATRTLIHWLEGRGR